jgi:TM2 domain-containing membrane protein YozV
MSDKQTHGVPALLSFFIPGLGQLIKGHIFKAIGIWVALFISGMLVTLVIGLITTPLLWLWQIFDAYNN